MKAIPLGILASLYSRPTVRTPKACETCLYRTEEFRDGGWCYFWRESDVPARRAEFEPATPPSPSAGRRGDA